MTSLPHELRNLPQRLFKEVDGLGETIGKVHAARLNAKSNTNAAQAQGEYALVYDYDDSLVGLRWPTWLRRSLCKTRISEVRTSDACHSPIPDSSDGLCPVSGDPIHG